MTTERMWNVCPTVLFTCSAVNVTSPTLIWFVDDIAFASYTRVMYQYPFTVVPQNLTFNTQLGGVEILILEATFDPNINRVNFLSTMRVNISAIQEASIADVGCGFFSETRRLQDIVFNSSAGS